MKFSLCKINEDFPSHKKSVKIQKILPMCFMLGKALRVGSCILFAYMLLSTGTTALHSPEGPDL